MNTGVVRKSQIPVGCLYNKDPKAFESYLSDHKDLQVFAVQNLLTRIRNKFLAYYYTVNYAKDLTESEQREWFEVLNLAGSRVTDVQVNLTDMLIKGVDYYQEYADKFSERLKESNLEKLFVIKTTEISIPLAALNPAYEKLNNKIHALNFSPIPSDAKASLISNLNESSIRTIFSMTLSALNKAIDFIEINNLKEPDKIDYLTYLLGAFIHSEESFPSSKQTDHLVNWYNTVEFSNKDNGERRKIFDDLINDCNGIN